MEAKDLEKFSNYDVGCGGVITNLITLKILKHDISSGYARVTLSNNGAKKRVTVHRLVALKFIPNPERKPCVNHKDLSLTELME